MIELVRRILWFWRAAIVCWYLRFTDWASIRNKKAGIRDWVEDRFAPTLVTICTYQMGRFAACHRLSQRISNSSTFPRGCQLVALFLSFPCFYAHDFFFKCAYFLNHRRLICISAKRGGLGGDNNLPKFDGFLLNLSKRIQLAQAYSNIARSLETSNRTLNKCHVHDEPIVVGEMANEAVEKVYTYPHRAVNQNKYQGRSSGRYFGEDNGALQTHRHQSPLSRR